MSFCLPPSVSPAFLGVNSSEQGILWETCILIERQHHSFRYSVAARLLEGLQVFQARAADADSKDPRPEGMSGKQAKRQAKAAAKQSIYVEGAEQIVRIAMPSNGFLKAHYMEDFEALVKSFKDNSQPFGQSKLVLPSRPCNKCGHKIWLKASQDP